jgi:YesN/AraC family two-component response regulator
MDRIKTILIVDDNALVSKTVASMIRISHPGTVIVHASHGAHAWEIINAPGSHFDLVITDNEMPKMSGPEMIEKIKEKYPKLHTIMMSGEAEPNGHGAHAFLPKPFDRGNLIETIKKVLRRQH